VKRTLLCLLLFSSLCLSLPLASAQSGDVSFGLGTVHDKATGSGLDTNSLLSCSPASDASCVLTGHLAGVMMGFNGNFMLTKKYGVGGDVVFQPARQNFAVLTPVSATNSQGENIQSRLTFYDFNGIAQPIKNKRLAVQVFGGFGGANLRFYDTLTGSSTIGSSNSSQYLSSANHFQLHAGVGVPFYFKEHFFVRPQFDIHYVPNLDQQYGRDIVTQGMVWVGYTFGGQ